MKKACYSFQEDISIEVGISKKTNFWQDKWTGEVALKDRFPAIYLLSVKRTGG